MFKSLQRSLLGRGVQVTRTADTARVRSLIEACRPVATDVPLVRVGPDADGGYLVPDDLEGVRLCLSPGVDDKIAFELDLAARGVPSALADHSISGLPLEHPMLSFEPLRVGALDAPGRTSLDGWVARVAPPRSGEAPDLLLQMDIEGAEYPALLAASSETLERFRVVVVELHHLDRLFDPVALDLLEACLERLLALFDVVHLHPNNALPVYRVDDLVVPQALEMTLYRKGRGGRGGTAPSLPHPLDRDCEPGRPTLALAPCWGGAGPSAS